MPPAGGAVCRSIQLLTLRLQQRWTERIYCESESESLPQNSWRGPGQILNPHSLKLPPGNVGLVGPEMGPSRARRLRYSRHKAMI